MPELDTC